MNYKCANDIYFSLIPVSLMSFVIIMPFGSLMSFGSLMPFGSLMSFASQMPFDSIMPFVR